MFNKLLNHLEEWLIAFLMAAATLVIFVAVVHRYLAGLPYIQDIALKVHMSWAQELCIILFVWMCKFGAAYGVRTGIHVGVDVVINRMSPRNRGRFVIFGLLAGAFFTGIIAVMGGAFVWDNGAHYAFLQLIGQTRDDVFEGPTTPDLEWPTWIVYSAIPLGSALMCYRFLQVCWSFHKTGELPKHDESHVEGIDEQTPLQVQGAKP
ncbi:MAG: TRAP transporter small permease [Burkholderiales bacterium]|nr:MAG: TRAP transporter small permease [Burkholderiales bacterium]